MSFVLENIGKTVGGAMHLEAIDLTIAPGSFNVICGRTLAGKTSLLRILAGLDRPTSGCLRWHGDDITRTSVRKRSVAMVYQQFINYPSFTVYENIASPLRRQRAADIDKRVRELAATLRIEQLLDRLPGQLSGGQQQRVAIARALAKQADLLLLDEPLVNLDYKLREELRDELRVILGQREVTVLYATTEPSEALALGGYTILMHEGRVLQHAPTLDVYHQPANTLAARLFSDPPMNLFDVTVQDQVAVLAPAVRIPLRGHLRGLGNGPYRFGIRARDCALVGADAAADDGADAAADDGADAVAGDGAAEVVVRAQVDLNEISGSETFVYLRHGNQSFIVQEQGVWHHAMGEELAFTIDVDKLLVFDADNNALVATYRQQDQHRAERGDHG